MTPLSGWTVLSALGGVVLALLAWRPLVRGTGWRPGWTLAGLLVLAGVLALTLSPAPDFPRPLGVRSCLRDAAGGLRADPLAGLGSAESLLNLVLLVPLGLVLVLATRARLLPVAVVVLLPAVVELTQTQVPGRLCSGSDYATNAAGGLAGVLVGVVVLAAAGRWRRG